MSKIYDQIRKPAYTIIALPTLILALLLMYSLNILSLAMEDSTELNIVVKIIADFVLIYITAYIGTLFLIGVINLIQYITA